MKTPVLIVVGLLVLMTCIASAGLITITLDDVPPGVQCNETWTNQGVVLKFTETIASEDGSGGRCSFGVSAGRVGLYPSRLHLDLASLPSPVSEIEADITSGCICTKLFAYASGSNIGEVENTTSAETLSLTFTNAPPDSCAVRSFEGAVWEIRLSTVETNSLSLRIQKAGSMVEILWAADEGPLVLERTEQLGMSPVWMSETNNITLEGSNYVHRLQAGSGTTFFRLRR